MFFVKNLNNHLRSQRKSTFFRPNRIVLKVMKSYKQQVHSGNIFKPNPDSDSAKIGDAVLTTKHGADVLNDPLINKGTGFPFEERERLGIRGLVPPRLPSSDALTWQVAKIMARYEMIETNIQKYIYLNSLHDRNEVLFFKCVEQNLKEIAPIIYTPTVGQACLNYSTLFRRPRGMYFSSDDRGMMHAMTFNWHTDDVDLIVVTDGSRVLGLGDLGTNGMGIPIGKLQLYTACAGIHPSKCLPVVIDVGTNNQSLINDNVYLGLHHERLTGSKFDEIIDEFISAVRERFSNALIQFEDFSTENASRILNKYRNKILCFNDDMQGTATVSLAGVLGALRFIGHKNPQNSLLEQRIVVVGAGTAGLGVSSGLLFSMAHSGLTEAEARKRFWIFDDKGTLGKGRSSNFDNQIPWIRDDIEDGLSLEELVENVKPTILLGLSGVGGVFTENVVRTMSKYCERPIIFPMSNPTNKAECTAENAYLWSDGKCIFGSGSPFPNVVYKGKILRPAQANNMYTYPAIGLGSLVCKARTITDSMLNAAAISLSNLLTDDDIAQGRIFPIVNDIPKLSKQIAFDIAKQASKEKVARLVFESDSALRKAIEDRFWVPKYGSLIKIS